METDPTEGDDRIARLDSRQIRTLAHPLRARLVGALRTDGPATATALAQALGTNTGATSYHLRQLAEVGLVVEEPDRNTGRQRWWRTAHDVSSWQPSAFDDDPDASAASDWMQTHQVRRLAEQAERWISAQHDQPRPWRDAAAISDALLTLSPERLQALNDDLDAVVERYRRETVPEGAGAELVLVYYAAFPRVGGVR